MYNKTKDKMCYFQKIRMYSNLICLIERKYIHTNYTKKRANYIKTIKQ